MKRAGLVCAGLAAAIALLLVAGLGALASASASTPGIQTLDGVPAAYRPWLQRASQECRFPALSPALLAAQLQQESGFRTEAVSPVGAVGPAQFMPGTWATWGRDDDRNGLASPHDIGDAVMAQGRFMCSLLGQANASGIAGDPRALALAGYNAGWAAVERFAGIPPYPETQHYVSSILESMARFQSGAVAGHGSGNSAVRRALTQLGVPYAYGGGTPSGPGTGFCADGNGYLDGRCVATTTVGWDCSSLVQYAYWPTTRLPRTAAEQYAATANRPVAKAELRSGDLLFWSRGGEASVYHVAIYVGEGKIVEAPKTGDVVKVADASTMPAADYFGATRP
ncbi:NlpC/P60 family protein [Kitasatospora terrestris]|uniref:Transglycosylase TgdA n=1 Tax=Kitasatospora terrestris TaxID=258051 RepID=A0ABP9DIV2_9ACTN